VLPPTIEVATPPEFAGGEPGIWSPEHLFAAAVNSCLMTTFLAIAANSKLEYLHFDSKATAKLEKAEGKFIISEISLEPVVELAADQSPDRALRVLEKAEANCLISNSIKSKILFRPVVNVKNAGAERI
jgi:organic hydroperoxide reductase OsmC/OhrA